MVVLQTNDIDDGIRIIVNQATGRVMALEIEKEKGLYEMDFQHIAKTSTISSRSTNSKMLWYECLGGIREEGVREFWTLVENIEDV